MLRLSGPLFPRFDNIKMISAACFWLEPSASDYAWFPPVTPLLPRDGIVPLLGWLSLITPLRDNKQGQKGNIYECSEKDTTCTVCGLKGQGQGRLTLLAFYE